MQAAALNILARVKRSPFLFPLALVAGMAMVLITETAYVQATGTLDDLGRTARAREHLQTLLRRTVDAESGQRGFLLTGREQYLDPYRAALNEIHASQRFLSDYYGAMPDHAGLMTRMNKALDAKLSELATVMTLYREGRHDAWRNLLLLDIGREKMAEIRNLSEDLLSVESRRVESGRRGIYDTLLLHRIGVGAMSAVSLLALFMYLRQTRALEAEQEERQQAMARQRDELEREVVERTRQLTELAQHLQTAREDERSRLARELHDELGALLTAAKLDAARIKSRLGGNSPEASERLAHLSETLNSGIALKRRIIEDLRPSTLSNFGLVPALEILAREFGERSQIEVFNRMSPVSLKPADELTAYRLVQEAFTNIAKHAQASRVELTLEEHEGMVQVAVRDNGVGFDTGGKTRSAHGLLGMRYRVEAAGGELSIVSTPGLGTQVLALLPMKPAGATA
ncbi:MAG: CHASE3 domain-containing protein [Aquincola tertiaricarbonis]|uniref:CHASE3 domain-containing protein n=1 Tax=Aquincola TaxID=391952 RepID=UPI0006150808|nr:MULTISPECIES: CHASE3 domain-containing protein [Aquincola]MCR5863724.1 CHASE3 domain-containing protein [Aquincola sp. J276]